MNVKSATDIGLKIVDLGRLAYAPALAEQRRVNQAVIDGLEPATLLLVEHEPVITVSHRRNARGNIVAPSQRLAALGIDVQETDRGGDVTYHGPGQLVAYPILKMGDLGLNLGRYMRWLEGVVIDTLGEFGVMGERDACATGVWVRRGASRAVPGPGWLETMDDNAKPRAVCDPALAKVCAMGVRVRKNVTMHGLALNVTTDLSHFATIVPCGLTGRPVTSLRELLGEACPSMDQVKAALVKQFERHVADASA